MQLLILFQVLGNSRLPQRRRTGSRRHAASRDGKRQLSAREVERYGAAPAVAPMLPVVWRRLMCVSESATKHRPMYPRALRFHELLLLHRLPPIFPIRVKHAGAGRTTTNHRGREFCYCFCVSLLDEKTKRARERRLGCRIGLCANSHIHFDEACYTWWFFRRSIMISLKNF